MDAWSEPRSRRSWWAAGVGALMVALAVGAAAAHGSASVPQQTVGGPAQQVPAPDEADKGTNGRGQGPKVRPPVAPEADPRVAAARGDEKPDRSRRPKVDAPPAPKAAPQNAAPVPDDLAPDPAAARQLGNRGQG